MLKYTMLILLISINSMSAQHFYSWVVIGAGPAGVVSVTQLLEHGVADKDIMWIDPEFSSGRMGKYYGNVPSNQMAQQFTSFLDESSILKSFDSPAVKAVRDFNQQQEFPLQLAVDVMNDVTQYLHTCVTWQKDTAHALWREQDLWKIALNEGAVYARKVILATGSHPKKMHYEGPQEIPLDSALDVNKLLPTITLDDVVMVVGSAHSAFLIVKYLYDFGVKKIISVYNREPRFGVPGGLIGMTAYWTQHVLLNNTPTTIERVQFDPNTMPAHVAQCTKIIYAFGYEPNEIMVNGSCNLCYDLKTGVIDKNLYGIGIAFPHCHKFDDGSLVNLIGFNSFMYRAKNCMPFWLQQSFGCQHDIANESGICQPARDNDVELPHQILCPEAATLEWEDRWI